MFISPKTAIENGWITHPKCNSIQDWTDNKFISPNAIDFTADVLHRVVHTDVAILSEKRKTMRLHSEVEMMIEKRPNGEKYWVIGADTVHDFTSDMYVKVPNGVACLLIARSTLTRNGVFITSGLYDQGFEGHIGGTIYTPGGSLWLAQNTRIGQIIFVASEDSGVLYAGGWNHATGTHYTGEKL